MRRDAFAWVAVWLGGVIALSGCFDDGPPREGCGGDACGSYANGGTGGGECTASVVSDSVFYDNVCVSTWVRCGSVDQAPTDDETGGTFCDLEGITCTDPDHVTARLHYVPMGRACYLCTEADGDRRCSLIPAGCGEHAITHVASGSPDAGTHPQTSCDDGGV
jgi:hypothetical protein